MRRHVQYWGSSGIVLDMRATHKTAYQILANNEVHIANTEGVLGCILNIRMEHEMANSIPGRHIRHRTRHSRATLAASLDTRAHQGNMLVSRQVH